MLVFYIIRDILQSTFPRILDMHEMQILEMVMELRQLESFVHVAELGSFTRASNFLSVAQPVLEPSGAGFWRWNFARRCLSVTVSGVTLTEAGKRLLGMAAAFSPR